VGLEADNLEQQLEARDPDVRLMVQVRGDVVGAFETLVERYQNRLVGILFHLVGNREEAEDLCQEVFLRIYKARKGYRPRAKFSTWHELGGGRLRCSTACWPRGNALGSDAPDGISGPRSRGAHRAQRGPEAGCFA
jgi:hypothetical protein